MNIKELINKLVEILEEDGNLDIMKIELESDYKTIQRNLKDIYVTFKPRTGVNYLVLEGDR